MNLGQIVDASIAQVVGVTQTDRLVNASPEFVKVMVNKGYHIIERTALWKFSEAEADITALAGIRACADVPADMGVPLGVYSPRLHAPLEFHDERQRFGSNGSGHVTSYGLWGGELRFYPMPKENETLLLKYYKTWPDLILDADEPLIPATFHDLLVDYGSYHLALRLPPTGDRFLPNSAAQPYLDGFNANLLQMLSSDLVLPTFDEVPNYGFIENVLGQPEW